MAQKRKKNGQFTTTNKFEGRSLKMPAEQLQAILGRAASGAAGTHGDRRLKRLGERGAARRAAIKESW